MLVAVEVRPVALQGVPPIYTVSKQVSSVQLKEGQLLSTVSAIPARSIAVKADAITYRVKRSAPLSSAVGGLISLLQKGSAKVLQFANPDLFPVPGRERKMMPLNSALQAVARVARSEDGLGMTSSDKLYGGMSTVDSLVPTTFFNLEGHMQKQPSSQRSAMVSGGLGSLGFLSSSWMVEEGWHSVTLLGRSGRAELSHSCIYKATAMVTMMRCDVSAASEIAEIAEVTNSHQITDLIHAGGVLRDASIGRQTLSGIREVLAPKASGLINIFMAFSAHKAQITAFSSIAGVLGSAGQANYAAANSFVDAAMEQHSNQVVHRVKLLRQGSSASVPPVA